MPLPLALLHRLLVFVNLAVLAAGSAGIAAAAQLETERHYLSGTGPDDAVEWDFKVSDGRRSGEWSKIPVPSVWEQQGFGTYNYGIRYYGKPNPPAIAREQGIYRHTFFVPAEWQGRRVRLVFEGAMTDTHVRLNGISMGPAHQGGFYRFRHEVTQWLKYGGDNQLEITVDKESANESVNMAERRADYWNFGGIFRPVFLEVLPSHFIDRLAIAAGAEGEFLADVFLGDAVPGARVIAQVVDAEGRPIGEPFAGDVRSGSDRVTLRTQIPEVRAWTAETPHLYSVRVTLSVARDGEEAGSKGQGKGSTAAAADDRTSRPEVGDLGYTPLHQVTERFGFRTFEIRRGEGLYLNGRRILLKGINRHSFRPASGRALSRDDNYADVRLIKELNMNAVRMSHYPPDPAFLQACDELGLYVINELGGWHGAYDTGVGRGLVQAMVTRDVNHPSILFWANGNEGGWNVELDDDFARWDPSNRPVLHPQQDLNGIESMHYRSYGETQEYLRGHDIYLPTEFLHGLYDGGHGAGLWDYWEMMRRHPRSGGGFLWVLADEGIVRTDQAGRIDTAGNYGADGIVGPNHEREGSFYAVKEIWSPVQVWPVVGAATPGAGSTERGAKGAGGEQGGGSAIAAVADRGPRSTTSAPAQRGGDEGTPIHQLPPDFDGRIVLENRYDFTDLSACRVSWSLGRFPAPAAEVAGHKVMAAGELRGPVAAPGRRATLQLPLPSEWKSHDVLYVTARGPGDEELWTWSWRIPRETALSVPPSSSASSVPVKVPTITESADEWLVRAGDVELCFARATGELSEVRRDGQPLGLQGPRFIAARRADRSVDGWVAENLATGVDRIYSDVSGGRELTALRVRMEGPNAIVEADYFGALVATRWRISGAGRVQLDYTYRYDGVVELMGIHFPYPEDAMEGIRWLGRGPYRVWQNRQHGTRLDVWENDYNDAIPAESFDYPEFKGYFDGWQWATFRTAHGPMTLHNQTPGSFLGVLTPRDGRDALLFTLPETGIGVFDVIPAIRNKVNATDLVGPSSQAQRVSGERNGRVFFDFGADE